MKRAIKSRFKCSREDLNRLFACNRISALVWNKILELQREELRSKGDLQKALKGLYPINSQSVQAVTDKYCAACYRGGISASIWSIWHTNLRRLVLSLKKYRKHIQRRPVRSADDDTSATAETIGAVAVIQLIATYTAREIF